MGGTGSSPSLDEARATAPLRDGEPSLPPPDEQPSAPPSRWAWLGPISVLLWPVVQLLSGAWRWDYLFLFPIIIGLFSAGQRGRRLFWGLYPIALVGIFYELQPRLRGPVVAANVHLCDLRALEARFFGFGLGDGQTLHDWIQRHRWLPLDLAGALPYGTYLFMAIGAVAWLFKRDEGRMRVFSWSFLALNLIGFTTYQLYPAAPPWYYHAHGCLVDAAAVPHPGPNLSTVDQWLGYAYFAKLYSRSATVYGAMPSLHVAYPMMILLGTWRSSGPALRAAAVGYVVWMCSSAVYLDHHWVLDIVLGLSYAVLCFVSFRPIVDRWTAPRGPVLQTAPAE
ncbi:MAG: inositol phosphorylceramide synthase [Myxococcales bacterium]|nr:MAG: inositol phosphorylceramide synthase [Myxococcales bacterium]